MAAMSDDQRRLSMAQERLESDIYQRAVLTRDVARLKQQLSQKIKEHNNQIYTIQDLMERGFIQGDGTGVYEGAMSYLKKLKKDVDSLRRALSMAQEDLEDVEKAISKMQERIQRVLQEDADREARKQAALADEERRMIEYHTKECADAEARLNNPECVIMKRGGQVNRIGRMK